MGKVLRVSQDEPSDEVVLEAASVLRAGGVVVMPTDSVYGIGCAMLEENPGRVCVFDIKRRDLSQTLPLLVADHDDLPRYARTVGRAAVVLAGEFWPGALTMVVPASDEVPPEYRAADGTVALRMPDSNLVRELIRTVSVPLAVTSANTHGEAAATSGEGVEPRIVAEADLTLDAGPAPLAVASTIVSLVGAEPTILREGAIPGDQVYWAARSSTFDE
jgi:tRNA threonylcarbamoyl adenosine modification protein (Sua5/YciO/YrdC/YwlC family)